METKNSFGNLFELYIEQQRKKGLIESSLKRTTLVCQKYLLPSLAKRDVKGIRQSDLLAILNAIYNQNNPATSRLETIRRTRENERFRCFKIDEILARDKTNLDIFWLKDESLKTLADLASPAEIAAEIRADLQEALGEFEFFGEFGE